MPKSFPTPIAKAPVSTPIAVPPKAPAPVAKSISVAPPVAAPPVAAPIAKAPPPAEPKIEISKAPPVPVEPNVPLVTESDDFDIPAPSLSDDEILAELESDAVSKPANKPAFAAPILDEPAVAQPLEDQSLDLELSDSEPKTGMAPVGAPLVGVLEEPARFRTASVAATAVATPVAAPSNDLMGWVRAHKWTCIIGGIAAWIVIAVGFRLIHPMAVLRKTTEEMELRQKYEAAMAEQNAKLNRAIDSKAKDQSTAADKSTKSDSAAK
jgi:hypothetical protein